ncbi:winged helix-turn-helix domain-containing protein [Candidatus Woesearchaeota archaeon]|nr:winged helix-turn-helix domain-containing protein [Candidatus Woesearchaeota archaeon]
MRTLDEQEIKIVRELIRNPRISDNQLSKKTKIPVMSVNRKRKKLENENLLYYFAYLNKGNAKTHIYKARQLYIIQFKIGITREEYLKAIEEDKKFQETNARYHANSFLGEKEGHLALAIILEAESQSKLIDVFNGYVIKGLKDRYGDDCISKINTIRLDLPIRLHHNYLPIMNMENGIIKEDWLDEWIFVQ